MLPTLTVVAAFVVVLKRVVAVVKKTRDRGRGTVIEDDATGTNANSNGTSQILS
jgi:hypothetical protein